MQNSYFDLSTKSNSFSIFNLKLQHIFENFSPLVPQIINKTLFSLILNFSINCSFSSSLNNFANDPTNSLFSLIFTNPKAEAPSDLYSSSSFLYHEFDLSHESTLKHFTSLSLNTGVSFLESNSVIFSISN